MRRRLRGRLRARLRVRRRLRGRLRVRRRLRLRLRLRVRRRLRGRLRLRLRRVRIQHRSPRLRHQNVHRARRGIKLNTRHGPHAIQVSRHAVSLRHPPHELIQRRVHATVIRRGNHTNAAGQGLTCVSVHNIVWNPLGDNPVLNRQNVLVQTLHLSKERLIRRSRRRRVRNSLQADSATAHLHAADLTASLNGNARILVSLLQQGANTRARIHVLILQRATTIRQRHLGRASQTLVISRQRLGAHQATLNGLHLIGSQKLRRKTLHVNIARIRQLIRHHVTEILAPVNRFQLQRRNLLRGTVAHRQAHSISNRRNRHQRGITQRTTRSLTLLQELSRRSRVQRRLINTRRKIRITKHKLTHTSTLSGILNEIKRRELIGRHTLVTHKRRIICALARVHRRSDRLQRVTNRRHLRMHNVLANSSTVHALTEHQHSAIRSRATKQERDTLSERILLTRKLVRQQLNGLISHAATLTRHRRLIRPRTIRTRRALRLSIRRSHITGSSSSTHATTHARNSRSSRQKRETSTRTLALRNTQGTLLYCRKHVTKQISRQRYHHNIAELKTKRAARKDAAAETHTRPHMRYTTINTRKHTNHHRERSPTMNTNINKIAEAASLLASRAANLAVMTALTDAWNSLTDQQKADFTSNIGNYDQVAVAISIEGDSARLVTDEWHETIHTTNGSAADTYERAVETALSNIDDGADPEEGTSYRPLYYTQGDLDTARNMYQVAADHMAQLLAAN